MIDWFVFLAPLAILPIFVLFIFVGCPAPEQVALPDHTDTTEPPPPPPHCELTSHLAKSETGPTFNFLGVYIGEAAEGRRVIVAAAVAIPSGLDLEVWINGSQAGYVDGISTYSPGAGPRLAVDLFILQVDDGTTADIVVNCNPSEPKSALGCGLIVWAAYGMTSSTAIASGSAEGTNQPVGGGPPYGGLALMTVSNLGMVPPSGFGLAATVSYHPNLVPVHDWLKPSGFSVEEWDGEIAGGTTSHSGQGVYPTSDDSQVWTAHVEVVGSTEAPLQSALVAATFG
jgi:hypothetical protein